MDALILAAGLGTRLGDITADTPKALVDVAGRSALERVARQLVDAGADRLIINIHHHADRIVEHVREHGGFGVEVLFSREPDAPLETGGGLRHAAHLFRRDRPFFLHNVDVLTDADLRALYAAHEAAGPLATLAVSERPTSRTLLFDEFGLVGRAAGRTGERSLVRRPRSALRESAFAGVHVVSPELPDLLTETGAFSIMQPYLRLAAEGRRIVDHDITGATWLEIGTPERLAAARHFFGG
jgi:NDP-sugar pyrophosphorylase family protein